MHYGEVRGRLEDLEIFSETGDETGSATVPKLPHRVNLDPKKVEHGLVQLVLSVIELLRQLMEKQALRRIEGGSLSVDQVEQLGTTLMRLEEQMIHLKEHFQIDDLNIDLGPLGDLLDREPFKRP
jgi:hypothetical protein